MIRILKQLIFKIMGIDRFEYEHYVIYNKFVYDEKREHITGEMTVTPHSPNEAGTKIHVKVKPYNSQGYQFGVVSIISTRSNELLKYNIKMRRSGIIDVSFIMPDSDVRVNVYGQHLITGC